MPYKLLDPDKITATARLLQRRTDERFPDSGLSKVGEELVGLAKDARETSAALEKPILGLRLVSIALSALIVIGLGVTVYNLSPPGRALTEEKLSFVEFVQVLEAGLNDLVLIGLGVVFLVSLERRIKRRRILGSLHQLRSIAHVIDMHQLTKDPEHSLQPVKNTASSPTRVLNAEELSRYLDYSSEMLSITGKIAAIHAQRLDDDVVLGAVNEIETLTTGLSHKIWQKLVILQSHRGFATPSRDHPTQGPSASSSSEGRR